MKLQGDLAFVVEDDVDLCGQFKVALEDAGYTVETFTEGDAAHARLQEDPAPRLVVLDLHLPNLTGNEIAWELWFERDQTYIIVVTADPEMANIHRGRSEMDYVFTKPLPLDYLTDLAKQLIGTKKRKVSNKIVHRAGRTTGSLES